MNAEITFSQLYFNASLRGFFFREQAENTMDELIERASESAGKYKTEIVEAIDDWCEFDGIELEALEEDFYSESVEYLAKLMDLELEQDEDDD